MLDTFSMAKQLSGEYREIFEKVDSYNMFVAGDEETMDEKIMDLYDLLMEAQQNNMPVEKIVGKDVEGFCKNFFEEEKEEKSPVDILKRIYEFMKIILIWTILDVIFWEETEGIKYIQSDATPFLAGVVAGCICGLIFKYGLKPYIFKNKKLKPIHYTAIIIGIFVVSIVGCMILFRDYEIKISSFPLLAISATYVAIYLLIRSVWRYKKFGRITKTDRQEKQIKKEFNKEVQGMSGEKAYAEIMAKRFSRMNRRKKKRGKAELTMTEFAEKMRKEQKYDAVYKRVFAFAIAAMVIIPSIRIMVNDGILDGIIFATIMGVVEGAIYHFFFKSDMAMTASNMMLQILEKCEEQGITIQEYLESLSEDNPKDE